MDIIIIGAGIGGLQAAKVLAEGGINVTVYEKCTRESISYDWLDDAETKVFRELNIPLDKCNVFRTDNATFVAPFSNKCLLVPVAEEKRDWSIERRPLSNTLADRAIAAGAKVNFDTAVDSLLFENGKVAGIIKDGKEIKADLVIDSSGVNSKFRASLPASYHITAQPARHEVFRAYRAFFKPTEGIGSPAEHRKKIFLKHLGEDGISWRVVEPNGDVNILVGRIGELTEATLDRAMADLRANDALISKDMIKGGIVCTIPVRYAISRMIGEGYALVGDSAFMTIPMIGSGIACALRAGQMLGEVITAAKSVAPDILWQYQYRYYTEVAASHVSVDMIKRYLLATPAEDVRFLFDGGIISDKELKCVAEGANLVLTPAQVLDKVKKGWKKLGVLLKLKGTISKGAKAEAIARAIPKNYDEAAVIAWQRQIDGIFGN